MYMLSKLISWLLILSVTKSETKLNLIKRTFKTNFQRSYFLIWQKRRGALLLRFSIITLPMDPAMGPNTYPWTMLVQTRALHPSPSVHFIVPPTSEILHTPLIQANAVAA